LLSFHYFLLYFTSYSYLDGMLSPFKILWRFKTFENGRKYS